MRTTDMADVLRRAGLKVVEVPGWKTRGHGVLNSVSAIICHHTAGPATGNFPSLDTVLNGRPDLDGPLAQLGLARDGTWYCIASGVSWHAGATQYTWQDNWHAIGVEAEAQGTGAAGDWPKVQMDAYARGMAALAKAFGVPNDRVLGHKEIASAVPGGRPNGRKIDPSFNMDTFRTAVAHPNTVQEDDMTPAEHDALVQTRADVAAIETSVAAIKAAVLAIKSEVFAMVADVAAPEEGISQRRAQERDLAVARRTETRLIATDAKVDALIENAGADGAAITTAVLAKVDAALDNLEITLSTEDPA